MDARALRAILEQVKRGELGLDDAVRRLAELPVQHVGDFAQLDGERALVVGRAQDGQGHHLVPVWFLAALVALLYVLWCGGLWLGTRLRKARAH